MLSVYLAFLGVLQRSRVFEPELEARLKFAVASGIISFWILASPLMSIAKGNVGPVIFAISMAVLLAKVHKGLMKTLAV